MFFWGKRNNDRVKYTYKRTVINHVTELQVILKNTQVLITELKFTETINEGYYGSYFKEVVDKVIKKDPVAEYIKKAFENGIMHTFDKSNKFDTLVNTNDIHKILYKPNVIIEESTYEE